MNLRNTTAEKIIGGAPEVLLGSPREVSSQEQGSQEDKGKWAGSCPLGLASCEIDRAHVVWINIHQQQRMEVEKKWQGNG